MKIVSEILQIPALLLVIISIITELILLIFIEVSYQKGYLLLFEPTKKIVIQKANITTIKFNEIISNGLYRYYADLKLIGKHMSTLILEGDDYNEEDTINKNSKFYKNYAESKNKYVFYSNYSIISENFKKYLDENNKLNYLKNYEEEFNVSIHPNDIIRTLIDGEKHKELNSISYYKFNGNINSLSTSSRISANYLISILKTIFIKRYLSKRSEMDYIHINLILKDEFYVYPPDLYNNTYMYLFPYYGNTTCNYSDNNNDVETQFPNCIYNYIKTESNQLISFSYPLNEAFFLQTTVYFNFIVINFCLTINFVKKPDFRTHTHLPHVCLEINLTKLLNSGDFENKEKINIGVFAKYSLNENHELMPVYYSNTESYEIIRKSYNDEKFGKHQITNKTFSFTLFHFLYLDIFANESCYKKKEVSLDLLYEEYEKIYNGFFNETKDLKEKENRFNMNASLKYFEIEKTTCKRNLYNQNVTISKDIFLIALYPLTCKFGLLQDSFFEVEMSIVNYPVLYTFAIISTNPKSTEAMFKSIVQIKIFRLFCFFFCSYINSTFISYFINAYFHWV